MYAYHKLVAKNGSHKLKAHIRSRICTYRVKKIKWVYLSLVSFIFVPMFIWICEERQIYMIQICHNIHVVLSKAAHQYRLV